MRVGGSGRPPPAARRSTESSTAGGRARRGSARGACRARPSSARLRVHWPASAAFSSRSAWARSRSSDEDPAPLAAGSCRAARTATHAAATPARRAVPGSPTARKPNRMCAAPTLPHRLAQRLCGLARPSRRNVCGRPLTLLVSRTRDVPAPFRCARRGRETRFVRLVDAAGAIVVVPRPGGPGGRPGRACHPIGLVEAGAGAERPRADPGARREPRAGGRRVQPREREARQDPERPAGEQARAPACAPESDTFPADALPAPRPDVHLRRREHWARGVARRELDRRADLSDRHAEPRLGPEHRGPEASEDLPERWSRSGERD